MYAFTTRRRRLVGRVDKKMIQKASILLIGMLSIAQSAPAIGAESLYPVTAAATSDGSTPALASPQNNMEKVIDPVTAAATSDGSTPALTSLQNNMEKVIDPVTAAATSDGSTPALTSPQNDVDDHPHAGISRMWRCAYVVVS